MAETSQCGSLRLIAAITQEAVITRILQHLKLSANPPPIAPARSRQEVFGWVASSVEEPQTSRAVGCAPRWSTTLRLASWAACVR